MRFAAILTPRAGGLKESGRGASAAQGEAGRGRQALPPALFETSEAKEILGFGENEEFVALIHLGQPATSPPAKERKPVSEYVEFLA